MYKEKSILTFIVIIVSLKGADQTNLADNLLVNHDFSIPNLTPYVASCILFNKTILGWNCSAYCKIINCQRFSLQLASQNLYMFSGNCPSQAIDTSSNSNGVISQLFEAHAGEHHLDIKFLSPITLARQKNLVVMINQEVVLKYHPLYQDFDFNERSMTITLREGVNKISFTAEGVNDDSGFRIFDVKIRRIIFPQANKLIDITTNNSLLSSLVSIPCSRIIFGELINTLISFDRMQLYNYHHRRYSQFYQKILNVIANLLNQKGTYATYISDAFFSSIGTSEESILKIIDFKQGRKYRDGYSKNSFIENGGLFFVVSSVPVALIIFFTFYSLFRITSRYKYSKILGKYSFFSLILLMLFEGNIEQFSFLIMDELLEYFSASFTHKAVNIAIAMIFYLIVFCSTAFYLYCWHLHRRKMGYLTDNVSLKMTGMIAYTFDRGLICLVLGSTHRLTLLHGKDQLLILAAVQLLLITPRIIFLIFTTYKCTKLGWMSAIEGFIRIFFQMSIFLYQDSGDLGGFINEQIHLRIIYLFLFIWTLNFVFCVIEVVRQFLTLKNEKNHQNHSKNVKTAKVSNLYRNKFSQFRRLKGQIPLYKINFQAKSKILHFHENK